jgi:hypothetical protein
VSDWVSLFQNAEENRFIRESEIGQYSCSNLLRKMEVVLSESDKEDVVMTARDEEVMFLPECVLEKFVEVRRDAGLPDNLYDLPDGPEQSGIMEVEQVGQVLDKTEKGGNKKKWGSVLVPRPRRQDNDGRTILEKAQDRKKLTNLDGCHGNSKIYNTFSVLSNSKIANVAKVVSVVIGNDKSEKASSLAKIQEVDLERARMFTDSYSVCQGNKVGEAPISEDSGYLGDGGDVAPATPLSQMFKSLDSEW